MKKNGKLNSVETPDKPWRIYTAISFISLVFVLIMISSFSKASHLIQEHSTVFNALSNVELEINNVHIWYDAVFSDLKTNKIGQAEKHLNKASRYVNALTKKDTINGVIYYPLSEKALISNINDLSIQIKNIKNVGEKYFAAKMKTGKVEGIPAELSKLLIDVSNSIKTLTALVRVNSANELQKFDVLRTIVILLFILFQILLLFAVYLYNKHRRHDFVSVQESYAKLQETFADLEIAKGIIKENAKQYKTLVNKAPVGIYELNRNAEFISVNPAGVKLRNFSKTEEIIGGSYFDFVCNTDKERIKQLFKEAINGKTNEFEYDAVTKNNRQQIISANFIPLLEENGTVSKVMGVTRDITAVVTYRRKLEKANLLYAILSEINQAIVRINNTKELYDKICEIFVEYGKFKQAWVGLQNFSDNSFKPVAHYGNINEKYFKNLSFSLNNEKYKNLSAIKTLKKNEVVIFNNIKNDPHYPFWKEDALNAGFVSGAAIPFSIYGKVIGIISIGSADLNYFSDQEQNLLHEISLDVSFAIEKIDSENKRRHAEEAILNIEAGISTAVGNKFFDSIVKSLNKTIGAFTTYVGEYDAETSTIKILSVYGNEKLSVKKSYMLKNTPCKLVIADGKYLVNGNLSAKFPADKLLKEMKIESYFGMRLMDSKNNITGIIVSLYTEKIKDKDFVNRIYNIFSSRVASELERKHAYNSLAESEKSYRELFDNSVDAIYLQDKSGKFISVNLGAVKMYGYSREYFIGKTPEFISAPGKNDLGTIEKMITKAWSGEPQSFEFWGIRRNGEIFPKEVKLRKGSYFGNDVVIAFATDITERKRREEMIKISEIRYRTLFDSSADAILLIQNNKFVDCNPQALTMFGCTRNQIIGKPPDYFSAVRQADGRLSSDLAEEFMANCIEGNCENFEWELTKFYGTIFSADIRLSKIEISGEIFILAIIRDISERKKAEKELILAREKAVASDKLKSEFLAQMSHEIRTPINTILSYSSLIKYELEDKVSSDLKESFVGIANAGTRIIRTIDLILNMSELQANSYDYRPRDITLMGNIFNKIKSEYETLAAGKGISLKFEQPKEEYHIFADEYTVEQIFANLIDNAVKYTQQGEVKLSYIKKDSSVSISIADTGIGISEEYLPRLFDPFSQEEQGYTRTFEGNGLGMALVKQYCDMNNADIEVKSEKGKGTTFTVTFKLY